MLPRERVAAVIRHQPFDRLPIYGWLRANLEPQLTARFGSVEAFEDRYEFDLAHLFGGPSPFNGEALDELRRRRGGTLAPADVLELPLTDPDRSADYDGLRAQLRHHQQQRGRFVYVQTPGLFEAYNGPFGIENHLAYLALERATLREVYRRQAEWNQRFAMNCLDLGLDMIHVSDDWGAQTGLLFSPAVWRDLIAPFHRVTTAAVKRRGAFVSLHSDGNIRAVLDGVVDLGYDVVHPFQESAGMSLAEFHDRYRDRLTVMGGLDIQTTLGFGKLDHLRAEITRVIDLFRDGGLLFCTTHFVQDHCTVDELVFAYDLVAELTRGQRR